MGVIDYLKRMKAENPLFFYAIQTESEIESENMNVFWADSISQTNYIYFGDTVTFDASSYSSRSTCFVTFTGLNHHAQPLLFGCALLFNQSDPSTLTWLLHTWLQAMSGKSPLSITINDLPNPLLHHAVSQILPETRLRFCKNTIFTQIKEKLTHVGPTFVIEFQNCVNESETIHDFESHWGVILEKYYLLDNEWLQSLYNTRHQWVPVYIRDVFFGEFSVAISDNSFFHEFVDSSMFDNSLFHVNLLIKQIEKTIINWQEIEQKADLETKNSTPFLKTPSPMEKQAANIYTKRIFTKFQEELVETLANLATKIDETGTVETYRVAKFGEEHKAQIVRFNTFEMKSNCTCQMFEFSGVICRHVLSVFRTKNVLTLPSQYVLKRWTRNAKSGGHEFQRNTESLTVRQNALENEAIKFVEEGAKSIHIYNVAVSALNEALKKVSSAKKFEKSEEKQAVNSQSMDKEKKIGELSAELECINQRCEVYRANLLTVLRDMEDQKLKLSVKVQNARLSLKE